MVKWGGSFGGYLRAARNSEEKSVSFNLIESTYEKGKYGFDCMQDIAKIADKSRIRKMSMKSSTVS